MDLSEKIEQVADRVKEQKDFIEGDESTKSTFVDPFIEALGYDTYDPSEVTPDFSVGGQGGRRETMDYALLSGGTPAILIVCKPAGAELAAAEAAPLLWALQQTEARVGILTNGVEYHFFCDRQNAGEGPFFTFDLLGYNVLEVEALKRLRASTLDLDGLISRLYEPAASTVGDDARVSDREFGSRKSRADTGQSGGVLQAFDTVVGWIVTIVKVLVGGIVFVIGAFVLLMVVAETYDEDGEEGTAEAFEARRSQIIETVESDLRAGRFRTAMDTADTYLEHVQDSTLQALRNEAEWAWRHDVDAWNACTDAVKEQLQRPSRADFPQWVLADTISYLRDRRFRIRAHVNPDSSSGEAPKVPFACVVENETGGGWSVQSVDIST